MDMININQVNNRWYSFQNLLSYNALVSVSIGLRGGGKSFGAKKLVIKDFLEKNNQFMYVRRYDSELSPKDNREASPKQTFFDDIMHENIFPEVEFEIKSGGAYINNKLAGYFASLTTASKLKSVAFPQVRTIIFDEFLIKPDARIGYLKNEVAELYDLMETVFRQRENVRLIMIGNSISFNNPYFMEWEIRPFTEGIRYYKDQHIAIELWSGEIHKEMTKKKKLFSLTKKSNWAQMAYANQFYLDDDKFVEERPHKSNYVMSIKYMGVDLGVWYSKDNDLFYCSTKHTDPGYPVRYALTDNDHNINFIMCGRLKQTQMANLKMYHMYSRCRFESRKVKSLMYEVFSLI